METSITPAQLQSALRSPSPPSVIDVRRVAAFEQSPEMIAGAVRRLPDTVGEWGNAFTGGRVVVYCVHGHEVSQGAAQALRASGVDACFLEGGIAQWIADGGALATGLGQSS